MDKTIDDVFRIFGEIFNELVPEDAEKLYSLKLIRPAHIVSIIDCLAGSLGDFKRLRHLTLNGFNGSLEPLRGAPLETVYMTSFNGSLEPLRGSPLRTVCMNCFEGSLEPLRGAPLG